MKRLFIGERWVGVRITEPPSRYFVLRDLERHPPLFSERNGYRLFRRVLKIGHWQFGWFV